MRASRYLRSRYLRSRYLRSRYLRSRYLRSPILVSASVCVLSLSGYTFSITLSSQDSVELKSRFNNCNRLSVTEVKRAPLCQSPCQLARIATSVSAPLRGLAEIVGCNLPGSRCLVAPSPTRNSTSPTSGGWWVSLCRQASDRSRPRDDRQRPVSVCLSLYSQPAASRLSIWSRDAPASSHHYSIRALPRS